MKVWWSTHKAVHTQGGAHTRWSTKGFLFFKVGAVAGPRVERSEPSVERREPKGTGGGGMGGGGYGGVQEGYAGGYRANSNILPKCLIPECFFLSAQKTRNTNFLNNSAVRDTGFRKKKHRLIK